MFILLVAAFCVGESVTALGWILYKGLRTGNTELQLETAFLAVAQLSLLAVGLGILAWARRKRITAFSRRTMALTYFTVLLVAAVTLGIFAFMSTGVPPAPVEAGPLSGDTALNPAPLPTRPPPADMRAAPKPATSKGQSHLRFRHVATA